MPALLLRLNIAQIFSGILKFHNNFITNKKNLTKNYFLSIINQARNLRPTSETSHFYLQCVQPSFKPFYTYCINIITYLQFNTNWAKRYCIIHQTNRFDIAKQSKHKPLNLISYEPKNFNTKLHIAPPACRCLRPKERPGLFQQYG